MSHGPLFSADHKNELTVLRTNFRASDWRVHKARAFGLNFLREALARAGRDGAGVDDDHAGADCVMDAVLTEEHLLDSVGIRDTEPNNLGVGGCLPGSSGDLHTGNVLAVRTIPASHLMAGLGEIARHWSAHDSQS